ncbi:MULTISPECIES: YheV family putative metal-binding protein [Moraxella]|uniref:YheV family putative metal-binding protein n=1 Tax=Moraxella nasicaprae TaxID=2904122 RepID=A0ABY6F222_9GAMM|nr:MULTISPECIES: YheV family putative metal-binding protein [Moraxella]MDO4894700.1 YheV family putative metal-binding protein [Moraxella sp.]UXZ04132.1 YheV family putative metal-binding protein [Moraxella nasicaprae]
MRYQSNRPKRQFLAGVRCPKCGQLDVVVQVQLFEPVPDEYIECTVCNHQERRPSREETLRIQEENAKADGVGVVKFR